MRKLFLLMAFVPMFLTSCSSDDEPQQAEPVIYQVTFTNHIDKSKVSQNYDGNVYDINLVSQNGNIYRVGDLGTNQSKTFSLPAGYEKDKVMFAIFKMGKNYIKAYEANYWTIEESYGKILRIWVSDNGPTEVYFTENTTYSSFPYSSLDDFKNMLSSILGGL